MKKTELISWLVMSIGIIIASLPIIATRMTNNQLNNNPILLIISALGVMIFLLACVKGLPSIIDGFLNAMNEQQKNGDVA